MPRPDLRRRPAPRRMTPLLTLGAVLLLAVAAQAQIHSSELPPLTRDAAFPRCGRSDLLVAGFPDHMHWHGWYGMEPLRGEDGQPYGPGSICEGKVLREGVARLVESEGRTAVGRFRMQHDPRVRTCDIVPFLELMEWAEVYVRDVLDLAVSDTLTMINPNGVEEYAALTGFGTWRLYARIGDEAVIQPYATLAARTLDGHAAAQLMVDWTLAENLPAPLPAWLHRGIVEYVAENGPHLANYMAEFRDKGPVLLSPPLVDAIIARGLDPDQGRDREMHRRAGYSAFLMVWELVENQGGLEALRDFLHQARDGIDLDQAAVNVYGLDLQGLAGLLDAAQLGEPYGKPVGRHSPHIQP